MTRRGRPVGFVSQMLIEAFRARPRRTVREVADELQLSPADARYRVKNLIADGRLVPVGEVPTGRRPAQLLAPPEVAPADTRGADLHMVMGLMIRSGGR